VPRIRAVPLDQAQRRRHKLRNLAHSALLLVGMTALLSFCAWLLVGGEGVLWGLAGAALALVFSPRVSPRLMLTMYRASEITPRDFPEGLEILRTLAGRAGLPHAPRLYYVPSRVLNAFAVGRRADSAIAVTDGLLRAMGMRELAAVFAHEISHIRNNDLWIMNLADAISRLTAFMAHAGIILLLFGLPYILLGGEGMPWLLALLLIFAPTLASLLQLALSRAREFDADLDAAGLTGDPAGLASALRRMELVQGNLWERLVLPGRRLPNPSLLRSHPDTEERIRRLLSLYAPAPRAPFGSEKRPGLSGRFQPVHGRPRYHLTGTWY
jgi:heat shock protein HtpX